MPHKPHRPKLKEKLFFFLSGAIISAPFPFIVTSLVSYALKNNLQSEFTASLISTALFAPIIEEFAKAFPLFYRHSETERSIMSLGFLTGLGFGLMEFLLYVFFFKAALVLRLPGLLFHATNTAIVAYGIGKKQTLKFYLLAVLLHFLNNFSAQYGDMWWLGGVAATLTSYFLALILYKRTTEKTIKLEV